MTARHLPKPDPDVDSLDAARGARLRYVTDLQPGIRRRRRGKGFIYIGPQGKPVRAGAPMRRIRALAIPPAWTDVWVCPSPRGHLQATGRDKKGRKQYLYHVKWRAVRDKTKFERMTAFGKGLPSIRARVQKDLGLAGLPRRKIVATVIYLLDTSFVRVGNSKYARDNESFGLTTFRDRHVKVWGTTLEFRFRGKSGKEHAVGIRNRRLARIVKACQELPGQTLFQYLDDRGEQRVIDSADVNDYLREASDESFTAKDFRTWAACVLGASTLYELGPFKTQTEAQRKVTEGIRRVAAILGNTPAICRKCYFHPDFVAAYLEGSFLKKWGRVMRQSTNGKRLAKEEVALLTFLNGSRRRRSAKVS